MKIWSFRYSALCVIVLILLVACGSGDSELIGKWERQNGTLEIRKNGTYLEEGFTTENILGQTFVSPKGRVETNWRKLDENRIETGFGIMEYSISGNQLTLKDPYGELFVYQRQGTQPE